MIRPYNEPNPPPYDEEDPPPPQRAWWVRAYRWWFIDAEVGMLRPRGFVTWAATIIVLGVWLLAWLHDRSEPCEDVVNATIQGHAPDGTPATISTSWCAKYKPGREPKP